MDSEAAQLTHAAGHEALDDPATSPELVARMLREIAVANRWFGGRAAVRKGLDALLTSADCGTKLSLFDIGTGAGDLPNWARDWAARRNIRLQPVGLERSTAAAQLARDSGMPVLLGSASHLPLRDRSVDIVLLSQVLHHFNDDSAVRLLREASRVAKRGVVIADLRPSWFAGTAFRAAGALLGFHHVTITDGITSLARGIDVERMSRLAFPICGRQFTLSTSPFARITAAWRTTA